VPPLTPPDLRVWYAGMKRTLATAFLCLLLTTSAWAGNDEGKLAYDRGDFAMALRAWRPLAEQGNAGAQHNLGLMYDNGQGVPQDHVAAAKWYRKAAEQGDARAQHNLGLMYYNGRGVPQDYAQAMRWFRKAAEQGNVRGQRNLGSMYGNGEGAPQDYVQAHKWFNLAASRGHKKAREYGDDIARKMTPAQIAEAQKLAHEWLAKHGKK